tara:strand:+ start:9264 stop:9665 length:402 start_codon:yes stop_codon:yes gene_type:complete
MNKMLIISLMFFTGYLYGADQNAAQNATNLLNSYYTATQSVTPNRALVYQSRKTDPDARQINTSTLSDNDLGDGQFRIVRNDSVNISRCSADYGVVSTISATEIVVDTNRFPIIVHCTDSIANDRVTYITMEQ